MGQIKIGDREYKLPFNYNIGHIWDAEGVMVMKFRLPVESGVKFGEAFAAQAQEVLSTYVAEALNRKAELEAALRQLLAALDGKPGIAHYYDDEPANLNAAMENAKRLLEALNG